MDPLIVWAKFSYAFSPVNIYLGYKSNSATLFLRCKLGHTDAHVSVHGIFFDIFSCIHFIDNN